MMRAMSSLKAPVPRIAIGLGGADLQHVQGNLCILRIVLVPPIVKGFTRSCERDRGYKLQLKASLEESIGKWPMIVPGCLEADNHGSAVVAKPIDETIMLSSGIKTTSWRGRLIPGISINTSLC